MSTVDQLMRVVRAKVEDKRERAGDALDAFAQRVAADAREHAPVRKAYRGKVNRKGDRGGQHRSPGRLPTDKEFERLGKMAAQTRFWSDVEKPAVFGEHPAIKRGWNQGYINPDIRIVRNRRPPPGLASRNRAASKWRVLGNIKQRRSGTGDIYYALKPRKGVRATASISPSLQNKEGTYEPPRLLHFTVGKGVLRYMNAKQKYAVLHNKGAVRIHENRRTHALKLVIGGALRDSIEADTDTRTLKATVSANVDYAKYVEFGTRHMAAQPFLMPAMMNARKRMAKDIANAIRG